MSGGDEQGQAGDLGREALAYADSLYNLARYLTASDTDAEALVQATYGRALANAGHFRRGTNLKAWLLKILRNTFISQYRRERGNPAAAGFDTVASMPRAAADVGGVKDEVELDRLRKVVAEDIERALMALSEDARTIILLDLETLSEREVAEVMGCAAGTVKPRLARARASLRSLLKNGRQ